MLSHAKVTNYCIVPRWNYFLLIMALYLLMGIFLFSLGAGIVWVKADTSVIWREKVKLETTIQQLESVIDGLEAEQNLLTETQQVVVTAYNTVVAQTDNSPCIAANGDNICGRTDCVIANNDYPFGTKVDLEGFGTCTVVDRMNSRYSWTSEIEVDVSFDKNTSGALQFGKQALAMIIL